MKAGTSSVAGYQTPDRRFVIGSDIGGTFTDVVLLDVVTGSVRVGKILTTPDDPSAAVAQAIQELLAAHGVPDGSAVRTVLHATTLAANAIIERKGPRTGLLATDGFTDAIEIRDESRYDPFDLFLEMPSPLVPRRLRRGVVERTQPDGTVSLALDRSQAGAQLEALRDAGVEAVAVSLLHSYANPQNERALALLAREILPHAEISLSSEVVPEIREYPRTSTTIANVYVQRLMADYLQRLRERLERLGIDAELLVMQSNGGVCTVETACRFPVRVVESGPAAGALGASYHARQTGRSDLLAFDMGGTTAKAAVIASGEPRRATEFEVARIWRFKKGSGIPLKTPVVDLVEIGAGGGSISYVDGVGRLRVGPESAGSRPGPACYGQGGTAPTVTDADLLLGYLDPHFFLGGKLTLDVDAATRAISRHVAAPLGLDVFEAAWGIHKLVNETMAGALLTAATESGLDVRALPICAFGGAGPVHSDGIGRILRAPEFFVPPFAGVASALGLLSAPIKFDFVRSAMRRLRELDWSTVTRAYAEMEDEARMMMSAAGLPGEQVSFQRSADLRYAGQGYELETPLELEQGREGVASAFRRTYVQAYGREMPDVPVEVVNWRVAAVGITPTLPRGSGDATSAMTASDKHDAALKGRRPTFSGVKRAFEDTPVYDRYSLSPGRSIAGPAIVEERESTTLVGEGATAHVDDFANLVVRL